MIASPAPADNQEPEQGSPRETPVLSKDANEFAEAIKGYAAMPIVRMSVAAALIGVGVVLAFSLLVAILLPDSSLVSFDSDDQLGLFRETMLYASGTSLSGLTISGEGQSFSFHTFPLLFAFVPLLGTAFGVSRQFQGAGPLNPRHLALNAIGVAIPFALFMAVLVLLGSGEADGNKLTSPLGGTILLSLALGAIGATLGMGFNIWKGGSLSTFPLPNFVREYASLGRDILKPLAVAFVILSILGTLVWSVQSVRDAADARGERGVVTAVVDNVLYTGDLGVRNLGLGVMAEFEISGFGSNAATPIPISGEGEPGSKLDSLTDDGKFRLTNYADVFSALVFVPLGVILIVIPALMALYAGFLVGRRRRNEEPVRAAMWAASVGPVWAIVGVVINALSEDLAFGGLSGDSFFVMLLIGGAVVGAVGGFTGAQSSGGRGSEDESLGGKLGA